MNRILCTFLAVALSSHTPHAYSFNYQQMDKDALAKALLYTSAAYGAYKLFYNTYKFSVRKYNELESLNSSIQKKIQAVTTGPYQSIQKTLEPTVRQELRKDLLRTHLPMELEKVVDFCIPQAIKFSQEALTAYIKYKNDPVRTNGGSKYSLYHDVAFDFFKQFDFSALDTSEDRSKTPHFSPYGGVSLYVDSKTPEEFELAIFIDLFYKNKWESDKYTGLSYRLVDNNGDIAKKLQPYTLTLTSKSQDRYARPILVYSSFQMATFPAQYSYDDLKYSNYVGTPHNKNEAPATFIKILPENPEMNKTEITEKLTQLKNEKIKELRDLAKQVQ